jgi:glutamate-1-semialdehyde 2,1-aminomutase
LEGLRDLTRLHGALLIFDEVMTGFRVHSGGAQALYNIQPDLTTLGKVIGGGVPVGAFGGRREVMSMIAPSGSVYQAGTFSGNPLAMAAGIKTLQLLDDWKVWDQFDKIGKQFEEGVNCILQSKAVPAVFQRVGAMFTLFFTPNAVTNWSLAAGSDRGRYGSFFRAMLEDGVYLAPSQFEAGFLSTSHGEDELKLTLVAMERALVSLFNL